MSYALRSSMPFIFNQIIFVCYLKIVILKKNLAPLHISIHNEPYCYFVVAFLVWNLTCPLPSMAIKVLDLFVLQVNDEYMKTLEILSKKLKFVDMDLMVKMSKALKDVQPELEKLRQKAVSKVNF